MIMNLLLSSKVMKSDFTNENIACSEKCDVVAYQKTFDERWSNAVDRIKNHKAKIVIKRTLHSVEDGEKPDMIKSSHSVMYLGSGKAVKYV